MAGPVIRFVNPEGLPEPVGFSHAVEAVGGRTLYLAGQTGHYGDGSIDDGLVDQFRRALGNVAACLGEAGFPPQSMARIVIYTTDIEEYRSQLRPLGEAYRAVFGHHYPAMALIVVPALFDPAAKVELVGTAVL